MPDPTPTDGNGPGPGLSRLLAPRSVVVAGATDRPGSYAAQTLLNLRRAGYPGAVVGVHPHRTEVLGVRCVPGLEDAATLLGAAPDAVVIATPAASVPGYLTAAGRLGAGGAVVYAAGFGESGDAAAERGLIAAAAEHRLPVLGPNANGFVAVGARTPLWGDAVTLPAEPGPIALITQSGNVGVLALAHRRGLGLHAVVSLGNAAVTDAPAVLSHLARADGVRVVALYLEDDGDGARLADALAECARADVRIAVLKAGRSPAGRQAAGAHTAALAGDHRVFAALVEEAGGVLARDPHDLLETARALAGRRAPGRLAVLTASGGDAAIAADLAADAGVPLADLAAGTRQVLARVLPHTATVTNPLDHTNLVWADTEAIAAITAALASDPGVGPVIYVQDEPPGLPAVDAAEWAATRAGAVLGGRRAGTEILLVATTPGQEPPGAVAGLRAALAATAALRRPAPDPGRLRSIATAARAATIPDAVSHAAVSRTAGARELGGWLAEHEAKGVLAEAGLPVPDHAVVAVPPGFDPESTGDRDPELERTVEACVAEARKVGFPVAVKLSAPGLLHKSEAGALALNVAGDDQVRDAARILLAPTGLGRLGANRAGLVLLVERMAAPGVELLVAAVRDGVVPALVIGLGGVWAELLDDVAVLPLPAEPARVVEALGRLRAAPLLTGARGRPPADLAAIAEIACRIGDLLLTGGFSLIEVNPLIVSLGPAGPGSAPAAAVADALARR